MIPVTVIGGYLGSGKTTLINHLLRHADGQRLAVLVNEFGALSIDHDLIEAQDDTVISLAGGCICCSFGDNLIGTLQDLAAISPAPDHIVIEASGVAIPESIAASLTILKKISLNCLIVLADSLHIRANATNKYLCDTILQQLRGAELILHTKTDLVTQQAAAETAAWLAQTSPRATIIDLQHGRIANAVLLGPREIQHEFQAHLHHDDLFESMVCHLSRPVDTQDLAETLCTKNLGIIRAKGFVQDLTGDRYTLQIVNQRYDIFPTDQQTMALVCIGRKDILQREKITQLITQKNNK